MPRQLTQRHYDEIENQLAQVRAALALSGVVSNTSWQQAAWFVDPANSTGVASDNNSGLTALAPVRTWNGGVIARLGTFAPRLRQNTTITFLSSHVDNTDPVIFGPFIENRAVVSIQGALPAPSATGVLGVVSAKNRATNTILSAVTVPGTNTPGQLVVNTTRGNSRAMVYRVAGGPSVLLSQPYAPQTPPVPLIPPQNNAWATGDAVQVFDLVRVNIESLFPSFADPSPTFNNALAIYQLTAFDPLGAGSSVLVASQTSISFLECAIQRIISMTVGGSIASSTQNCALLGGFDGGALSGIAAGSFLRFNGGFVLLVIGASGAQFDGDFIFGNGNILNGLTLLAGLGLVAIDTGTTLNIACDCDARTGSTLYNSNVIYGAGTLNVQGCNRLAYNAGAGSAVAEFPITPRIQINGGTTASAEDGGTPTTINGGITTTAAHLDAAFGVAGFGGKAFVLGGGSIANLPL